MSKYEKEWRENAEKCPYSTEEIFFNYFKWAPINIYSQLFISSQLKQQNGHSSASKTFTGRVNKFVNT